MSAKSTLIKKITALAEEDTVYEGGGRVIAQDGGNALAAVLEAIDSTVLERTLVFDVDGTEIHAAVAGRRLRGLHKVVPDIAEAAHALGKPLSREEPEVVRAVGDLLLLLCASASRVVVRNTPAKPLGSAAEAGLSADALSQMWEVQPDDAPASPMARFISANGPALAAFLRVDGGEVVESSGDTTVLQWIWENQVVPFRKRQKARAADPMLVCFDTSLSDGRTTGMAIAGAETLVFACDPAQTAPIVQSWQGITA